MAEQAKRVRAYNQEKDALLEKAKFFFQMFTPESEESLTKDFLELKIYKSPLVLDEVVAIIVDKANAQPELCELYARLCAKQVADEVRDNNGVSNFRNRLKLRAQKEFEMTKEEAAASRGRMARQKEIALAKDESRRRQVELELIDTHNKMVRRQFTGLKFVAHLYLVDIIELRVIFYVSTNLLSSVTDRPSDVDEYEADEVSVERAVWLFERIGKRIEEHNVQIATDPKRMPFPLDKTFEVLEEALPLVGDAVGQKIRNLLALRVNLWVTVDQTDATDENSALRRAIADMQTAMEAMRVAMASLEERNKTLLELVKATRN